jgi:hypothetical protein
VLIPLLGSDHNNRGIQCDMENVSAFPADNSQPRSLDDHVKEIMRQTEQQLRQLMAERKAVAKRIRMVKQTITGLANIFDDAVADFASLELIGHYRSRPRGITRACRQVLLEAQRPLCSREICEELQRRAPGILASHKDSKATINTILGRLVDYGEVTLVSRERGQREWLWSAPVPSESTSQSITPTLGR